MVSETINLFVYGTLMDEDVWSSFTSKTYESNIFMLHGFEKRRLKNRHYPGIIPNKDASVKGKIYFDVRNKDMLKLDLYEGDEYERIAISQQGVELHVYVYIGPADVLL